jgi:hypothetical protein
MEFSLTENTNTNLNNPQIKSKDEKDFYPIGINSTRHIDSVYFSLSSKLGDKWLFYKTQQSGNKNNKP